MIQIMASRWRCIGSCKHVRGRLHRSLSGMLAVLFVCCCERPVVEVMLSCSLWCRQMQTPICRVLIGSSRITETLCRHSLRPCVGIA